MRVLTAAQMREVDRRTIDEQGVPSLELMERAGREVVAATETQLLEGLDGGPVTVLCGRGNNGGDGWVVARILQTRGLRDVAGVLIGRLEEIEGDAREMLERARSAGVTIAEAPDETAWDGMVERLISSSLIVDALVGTGLNRPLAGTLARVATDVNAADRPVVSIDVPSGLLEQGANRGGGQGRRRGGARTGPPRSGRRSPLRLPLRSWLRCFTRMRPASLR